jgi:hypothetical protein
MNITVEQVVQATPEVHDLIGELNDVLGTAYEAHQRHGLSVEQLFESYVRFFLARFLQPNARRCKQRITPLSTALYSPLQWRCRSLSQSTQ